MAVVNGTRLDLLTGLFGDQEPQSRRTLQELALIFAEAVEHRDEVVYETYGCPGEVEGPPRLLYATTVLQPGRVGAENFMTRGHFHVRPDRGEVMLTLRGSGALILMDRDRRTWMEPMQPGSVHDIDGRLAHRVANTGDEPLVFFVTWMSDCGHDYQEIQSRGFGARLLRGADGSPDLIPAT